MRLASIVLPLLLALPALADAKPTQAASGSQKKEKDKPSKPAKVYTDDDLKNAGQDAKGGKGGAVTFLSEPQGQDGSSASAHGSSEAPQAGSSETRTVGESEDAQASSKSGGGAGELGWRARAREQREAIKNAEKEIARLEAQLEALNLDRQPSPADLLDPTRLQNREAQKVETRTQLEAAREHLVLARQAFEDLESEARKAGVPQGWLEER